MNEGNSWPALVVMIALGWTAVGTAIVGVWIALWLGVEPLAHAFGYTACAGSAAVATLHIRRYTCRAMRLIRTLHSPREVAEAQARADLHPIR